MQTKEAMPEAVVLTEEAASEFQKMLAAPVIKVEPVPTPLEWKRRDELDEDDRGYHWMKRPDNLMRPEPCRLEWCCGYLNIYILNYSGSVADNHTADNAQFAKMEVPPK